jgi:hypothetical protein
VPSLEAKKVKPDRQKKKDPERDLRESTVQLVVQNWSEFRRKTLSAAEKLNEPRKRQRLCRLFQNAADNLRLLEPVLLLDRSIPEIEVRMPGESTLKREKPGRLLVALLDAFAGYVKAIQPKKGTRGDAITPQLLQQLAELSRLNTGRTDWVWVGQKIKCVPGYIHGDEMQQADWARKTASQFFRHPFGLFKRRPLLIELRPNMVATRSSAGLEELYEYLSFLNTSQKLKGARPIFRRKSIIKKHDKKLLVSRWRHPSGEWLDNYNCPHCEFACLNKKYTLRHVRTLHGDCIHCSKLLKTKRDI